MITKKQACEIVIENFKQSCDFNEIQESQILQSSKLAVAMEYLDLLKDPQLKLYAANRGGALLGGWIEDGYKTLTFRELLDLLPD